MTDVEPREEAEDFKPSGTIAVTALFVLLLVLLWGSVYVILLARGTTT